MLAEHIKYTYMYINKMCMLRDVCRKVVYWWKCLTENIWQPVTTGREQ